MSAEITDELLAAARVYACAFRRRYRWTDPEEVLAEAYYALCYECRRFDPARHPGGTSKKAILSWLHQRINWHLERTYGYKPRTAKRRATVVSFKDLIGDDFDALWELVDPGQQTPQRIVEAREALQMALGLLSPRERLVVLLEAQKTARKDIAKQLGVTVSAIQCLIASAREQLSWRECRS